MLVRPTHDARALTPGSSASLEIVEGASNESPDSSGDVVLELVEGEIRRDRDGLAG